MARYSQGTALDGFSVTGMAYAARWTATNQIPERAVTEGLISRYGTINPTDGGDTSRFSISGKFSATDDTGITRASAYVIRSQLNLFNDFTYFLNDPVNGDQFHQLDQRIIGGGEALHIFQGDLFGLPMENEIGVQTRTDSIRVGLFNTTNRQYRSGVLDDRVLETSGAFYFDNGSAGPAGCAPASASVPTVTTPALSPTRRPTPARRGTPSSTRSSASCWDPGSTPNST